ncbi:MAG: 2-dehydropantoate 2-reductase [Sulfolobales archaeon]
MCNKETRWKKVHTVLVVGFGGVGGLVTYAFNSSGVRPTVVLRSTPKSRRIRTPSGAVVELDAAFTSWGNLGGYWDFIVVTTKAYDALEVIERLKSMRFGLAVFVQNGLRVFEAAESSLGGDSVAQLVLNHGVYWNEERGEFVWVGGSRSYIGTRGNPPSYLYHLVEYLRVLDVEVVRNIEPYRWLKLAVNASINALTAVLGVPNGYLVKVPELASAARLVAGEVAEVAKRAGIELPVDPVEEVLKVAEQTAGNISSTLADLRRCRKTEVDYINGAVVKLGRELNVATPYNEILYYLIKSLEVVCRHV